MIKTPVLYTERLKLRPMTETDFEDFYEYFATEEVRNSIGGFPPTEREAVKTIFMNNCISPFTWAIEHNKTCKVIGDVHFGYIVNNYLAHIGYVLNKSFWGNGYMTEAINKVTEFGFEEMDLGRIRAILLSSNRKSENVLKRCGYKKEAFIRDGDFNGRVENIFYYSKAKYEL